MEPSIRRRWVIFAIGLTVASLGISMITKSGMGTSPLTAPALVMSILTGKSIGAWLFVSNSILFVGEMILEEKGFARKNWVQIPGNVGFSALVDLFYWTLSGISLSTYFSKCIMLMIGVVCLGVGIGTQVLASVLLLPGEGFVYSLAKKFGQTFGKMKTVLDLSLITIAVTISLICTQTLHGVREGTLTAAILVGLISQLFRRVFGDRILGQEPNKEGMLATKKSVI